MVRLIIENRMRSNVTPGIRYRTNLREIEYELDNRLFLRNVLDIDAGCRFILRNIMDGWTGLHNGQTHTSIVGPKIGRYHARLEVTYSVETQRYHFHYVCGPVILDETLPVWKMQERSIK